MHTNKQHLENVYFYPSCWSYLFWLVYFYYYVWTIIFVSGFLYLSILTRLFGPVYLDPGNLTRLFCLVNFYLSILTSLFGTVYWNPLCLDPSLCGLIYFGGSCRRWPWLTWIHTLFYLTLRNRSLSCARGATYSYSLSCCCSPRSHWNFLINRLLGKSGEGESKANLRLRCLNTPPMWPPSSSWRSHPEA